MTDLPPGYSEISAEDCCVTCGYIHTRHNIPTCRFYTPPEPLGDGEMADGLRAAMARKYVKDETAQRWGAA